MSQIQPIDVINALPDYYLPYAQYVNQTRALPDSRDCLKQGSRFIIYAQYLNKLTHDKKFRKAVDTVSAGMKFSVHGDSSILGTAVRLSQPFSLRYPLVEVKGNNGSQIYGSSVHAQARYLEMRSNTLANEMTSLLKKETVDKWKLNYTQEEEYPTVLPSLFPNFINGCTGIGVAVATSIPTFNLKDVGKAALYMLENPNCSFDDIYCPIDFPTGATIVNEEEVKESLAKGKGKAAIIRAKLEYDNEKKEILVTELPYQTTSSAIIQQIQKKVEENAIIGIETAFDASDINGVQIIIKLNKSSTPERVIESLYKETSLQSSFGINMMMLENGVRPRLYNFFEILKIYLEHMQDVLRKSYIFDLNKAKNRLEVLEGYLKAIANIEEVVKIIKNSSSKSEAISSLQTTFNFTTVQVEAILKLQLQRLVNLERVNIEKEYSNLEITIDQLKNLLSNISEFRKQVKKEISRIVTAYGDERRTTNITLQKTEADEIIEEKNLLIHLTNFYNLYKEESSTLVSQSRKTKGSKVKLNKNETIIKTITSTSTSDLIFFSNKGRAYKLSNKDLIENSNIYDYLNLSIDEQIIEISSANDTSHIIFITKQGKIKKADRDIYNITKRGSNVIKIIEGDSLLKVLFLNSESIAILTKQGLFKIIETDTITPTGKTAQGIMAIKLNSKDEVVDAQVVINSTTEVLSVDENGMGARFLLSDFAPVGRSAKGKILQNSTNLVGFVLLDPTDEYILISSIKNILKIKIKEILLLNRGGIGVRLGAKNMIIKGILKV